MQAAAWPSGSSVKSVSLPGIEPDLRASRARVRIRHTPRTNRSAPRRGIERASGRFEICHAVHHTRRASSISQYPDLDLNQGLDLRRVQCYPLHHRDMCTSRSSVPTWIRTRTKTLGRSCAVRYTIGTFFPSRADDWIRTSIYRFTRPAPFSVEPRRHQARARGVEPRPPVLEAGCSPRSTLV